MRIVVIGAGVVGIVTAWFLAQDRHEVVVVDRNEDVAGLSSHANGGLLTPSQADPWNSPGIFKVLAGSIGREESAILVRAGALHNYLGWGLRFLSASRPEHFLRTLRANARLGVYSLDLFKTLRTGLDRNFDGADRGTMKIFETRAARDQAAELARLMKPFGVDHTVLEAEAAVEVEPALADGAGRIAGAIYYPLDESGDARLFTAALADRARASGVDIRLGVEVRKPVWRHRRIDHLQTSQGELHADAFVLAGGVLSPLLARKLGFRLPIRPVKGYSVTVPVAGWNARPSVPVVDDAMHVGLTPLGERMRAVGTAEFSGYDFAVKPRRIANLKAVALRVYPALAAYWNNALAVEWTGLRPMTPDCLPIVGESPIENLFLNTGHSYLGWTTAAGTSRIVADTIAGRAPTIDPVPYGLKRFKRLWS